MLKNCVCGALVALSLIVPINAKTSAKDAAESVMKKLGGTDTGFVYDCIGNDTKASCTAKHLMIDNTLTLRNVKVDYILNDKSANTGIAFDLQIKDPSIDSSVRELLPKSVNCTSPSTLQGTIYKGSLTCSLTSPTYTMQLKGAGALESKHLDKKDIASAIEEVESLFDDATDPQDALNDFRIDPREFMIELKGVKLGDKILAVLKKDEPAMTKEQYNATINMGVAMVPVALANGGLSQTTIDRLTRAATAIGEVLTSQKQQATITLKRKSGTMLDLADLPTFMANVDSDPMRLLQYLDEYQIAVVTR